MVMREQTLENEKRFAQNSPVSLDASKSAAQGLYTPAQRALRDSTIWTPIQGVLAIVQFFVFFISLILVARFLVFDSGFLAASISVCIKTAVLLTIMITGAMWEKTVFGQYLFAPQFFWEDVVSFLVIALHLLYVAAFMFDLTSAAMQMWIALAAYSAYVVNAAQFLWKLRQARLQGESLAHERKVDDAISSSSQSTLLRQVAGS